MDDKTKEYGDKHLPRHLFEAEMYKELLQLAEARGDRITHLEQQEEALRLAAAERWALLENQKELLRAVAVAAQKLVTYPPGVYATFSDRGWALAQTRNAIQDAVDGGVLEETEK